MSPLPFYEAVELSNAERIAVRLEIERTPRWRFLKLAKLHREWRDRAAYHQMLLAAAPEEKP